MPIARIVARRFQDALEFAENLRSRFHTIEIAAPGQRVEPNVDLEIRLDNCSPRAALGRVLEYLADHPSGMQPAEKATPSSAPVLHAPVKAVPPAPAKNFSPKMELPITQDVNVASIPRSAPAASLADELVVQRSWLRAVSTLFRSSAQGAAKSSTSLNDVASSSAKLRRELHDDRFWIPPAYKSRAWTEAERRRRAQTEQAGVPELATQGQSAASTALTPAPHPVNGEAAAFVSVPALTAESKPAPVAPAPSRAESAPARPTLTPRLRQLEARRWRQAAALATAAAALITISIMGLQSRPATPSSPVEVEREPVQQAPVKPAAEDGAARPSDSVLLSSAAGSEAERSAARLGGWRKRTARDEVDYIASDVTVRHFEANDEQRASERKAQNRGRVKTISDFEPPLETAGARSRPLRIKQISDFNVR